MWCSLFLPEYNYFEHPQFVKCSGKHESPSKKEATRQIQMAMLHNVS